MQPSGQDRRSGVTVCKPLTRITFPLHAHDATVIYGGEGDGGGGTSYIFKETIGDQKMYFKPKHEYKWFMFLNLSRLKERLKFKMQCQHLFCRLGCFLKHNVVQHGHIFSHESRVTGC